MPTMIKRFEHDCDQCVFLGQFEEFDLYYCDQKAANLPTVIARYGKGGDYMSGMAFTKQPALNEAKKRAMKIGLIDNL